MSKYVRFPSSGGGGGSVAWGDITGTLSNQTDLQAALNAAAAAAAWGSITGTLASQTDLATALGLKAALSSPALTGTPTINGLPATAVGDKVVAIYEKLDVGYSDNNGHVMKFLTTIQDSGGGSPVYNTTTGVFTVPAGRGGLYYLMARFSTSTAADAAESELDIEFQINAGTNIALGGSRYAAFLPFPTLNVPGVFWPLSAGDTVKFYLNVTSFGGTIMADDYHKQNHMCIVGPF